MKSLSTTDIRALINEERKAMRVSPQRLEQVVQRALFKAAYDPTMFAPGSGLDRACHLYAETLDPKRRKALKALVLVTQHHADLDSHINEALLHENTGIRLPGVERAELEFSAATLNAERVKWWDKVFN